MHWICSKLIHLKSLINAMPCPNSPENLCPARIEFFFFFFIFLFLCFQTADELYNACRFVPMFSSIDYKIVPRSCFVRVLDCAQILGVHALNCARFFVVCTLNCARILVVHALDCAQFLLHPALFPTLLEHWSLGMSWWTFSFRSVEAFGEGQRCGSDADH